MLFKLPIFNLPFQCYVFNFLRFGEIYAIICAQLPFRFLLLYSFIPYIQMEEDTKEIANEYKYTEGVLILVNEGYTQFYLI